MTLPDVGLILAAIAVLGILYPHVLYPLLLRIVHQFVARPVQEAPYLGNVTVVIAAFNEEHMIADCLRSIGNATDAPEYVHVVIADDGSTDDTVAIAQAMAEKIEPVRLTILRCPRGGKNAALRHALQHVTTDVVIFTDADCRMQSGAIGLLCAPFHDKRVGAVIGRLDRSSLLASGNSVEKGDARYRRLEDRINEMEGRISSTVTSNGALYAVRTQHLEELPDDRVADDWWNVLCAARNDKRIVVKLSARVVELRPTSLFMEYQRTIRTASSGMSCLIRMKSMLYPAAGWISWFMWSHRMLRWAGSLFFFLLLIATVLSVDDTLQFGLLFYGQFAMYALALLGYAGERFGTAIPVAGFIQYVLAMNAAFLRGFYRAMSGATLDAWIPSSAGKAQ